MRTEFLNLGAATAGLARLDTEAFERDDQHDLASALNTFKGNRDGCVYHMMQSMRPYQGGVEWRLRTYPPWLLAYPAEAIFFDRWTEELGKKEAPTDESESVLRMDEQLKLSIRNWEVGNGEWENTPWGRAEHKEKMRAILDKIARDPKHCDVRRLILSMDKGDLQVRDMCSAYTPEVHAQLVALREPLKALTRDVGDTNRATLRPPVLAIGEEIHRLGETHHMFNGELAMTAVFYALTHLLGDYKVYDPVDGDVWSTPYSTLRIAWDGCGPWKA